MTTAEIIRLAALSERYDQTSETAFLCHELDLLESTGRISPGDWERAKAEVMSAIEPNNTVGQHIDKKLCESGNHHPLPDNRARQAYWLAYADALEQAKRRLLEMVSDPDDKFGIGSMLSQWTGEEMAEEIEAAFEGRGDE